MPEPLTIGPTSLHPIIAVTLALIPATIGATSMSDSRNASPPLLPAVAPIELAMLCSFAVLSVVFRFPLIDDAFITFRYSENLRNGAGFVYNEGDAVLGTTSPLWGLLLAALRCLGFPYAQSSLVIGIAAALLTVRLLASESRERGVLVPLGAAIFFFPICHMTVTSGMETTLYFLTVLGALIANERGRGVTAGVLSAAAIGLRPDGVLVPIVITVGALLRGQGLPIRAILVTSALVVPCAATAAWYYGSPIPHSIVAKRLIHPGTITENIHSLAHRITRNDLDWAALVFGACGAAGLAVRRRVARPLYADLAVWLVLYLAGLVSSGVDPTFYWYFYPLWAVILSIGITGIGPAIGHFRNIRISPVSARNAFAILVIAFAAATHSKLMLRFENMRAYAELAPALKAAVRPGDTFYLCETGLIGFELLGHRIVDSSGINSPEVTELVRALKASEPDRWRDWHIDAVRRFEPSWVIAPRSICSIPGLEALPWFNERYSKAFSFDMFPDDAVEVFRRGIPPPAPVPTAPSPEPAS